MLVVLIASALISFVQVGDLLSPNVIPDTEPVAVIVIFSASRGVIAQYTTDMVDRSSTETILNEVIVDINKKHLQTYLH